jgi:hypothetical protein
VSSAWRSARQIALKNELVRREKKERKKKRNSSLTFHERRINKGKQLTCKDEELFHPFGFGRGQGILEVNSLTSEPIFGDIVGGFKT